MLRVAVGAASESGNERNMKRLKPAILCLALSITLAACDPAFVRSIKVEHPPPISSTWELPLSEIDALADSLGFVRNEPRAGSLETLESEGYEFVAYYERTEPEFSTIEWLTISSARGGRDYRLTFFAFVAASEPEQLRDFREALTVLLCEKGFVVEGSQDCPLW